MDEEDAEAAEISKRGKHKIELIKLKLMLNLNPDDQTYLGTLYRQFKNPKKLKPRIGKNFFPSALLSPAQCKKILGVIDYRSLEKYRKEYEDAARKATLILNPMNGGIGTSIERKTYLRQIWKDIGRRGKPVLGAKGCDLCFDIRLKGRKSKISISEAKILRALKEKSKYKKIVIQYLVSTETLKSVRSLLNKFPSLKGNDADIFSANLKLILVPPLLQQAFPTIHENGKWSLQRKAPGGHGQWLYILLKNALSLNLKTKQPTIAALYNEDGLNNTVEPMIVGWMVKEKIPAVMISTTKTFLDTKGGLIGLVRVQGKWKKEILELAQAEACGQEQLFFSMGIGTGRKAGQYFNTNTILLNYTVLLPILKKLLEQQGEKDLIQITGPDLIQNRKKQKERGKIKEYIQLEGALGSALLNLDNYFLRNGYQREFLKILNLNERVRYCFFTPIKNAFDFWIQFYSDLFKVNTKKWSLQYLGKGMLPKVVLSSYYNDLEHVLNAFGTNETRYGTASLKELKELEIQGKVLIAGAKLSDRVKIFSDSESLVDLNSPQYKKFFPLDKKGKLILKDKLIHIDSEGKLNLLSLRPRT